MSVFYRRCTLHIWFTGLLSLFCFFASQYLLAGNDQWKAPISSAEYQALKKANTVMWNCLRLDLLFNVRDESSLAQNNEHEADKQTLLESTAYQSVPDEPEPSRCRYLAESCQEDGCNHCLSFCCPCIGLACKAAYPDLSYAECCSDEVTTIENTYNDRILNRQGSLWLENRTVADALVLSNPQYYQVLSGNINRSAQRTILPLTRYHVVLLSILREQNLQPQYIQIGGNSLRYALLDEAIRYKLSETFTLITRIRLFISVLNQLHYNEIGSERASTDLLKKRMKRLGIDSVQLARIYNNALDYLFSDDDSLDRLEQTNQNGVPLHENLIIILPFVIGRPLMVFEPAEDHQGQIVDQYIIDQDSNIIRRANPRFTELADQATVLINTGNNYYLTATRIEAGVVDSNLEGGEVAMTRQMTEETISVSEHEQAQSHNATEHAAEPEDLLSWSLLPVDFFPTLSSSQ